MSNITLRVNGNLVNQLDQKVKVALETVGLVAEGYAKLECPVDTGHLRSSITHTVNDNIAIIGTNKEYAAYVEFGTGKYATNGGGTTKESWVYKDALGHWHSLHLRNLITNVKRKNHLSINFFLRISSTLFLSSKLVKS